jgi:conjugative relaxase-like TrwC/TraI family protein
MLNITKITPRGKAADSGGALIAYLQATEYYRAADGQEQSSSLWYGKSAAALGLHGVVAKDDMNQLIEGFAPDGRPLVQNAGEKPVWRPELDDKGQPRLDRHGNERGRWDGRTPAFDLTFSAPKSMSVLFAATHGSERDELLEAHSKAVRSTLEYLEQRLETRRGKGGKEVIGVKGIAASLHTHFASREVRDGELSQDCGDPQVHTHALLYNLCQGEDDRWATIDGNELLGSPKTLGALYRSELAANLRDLGYGIEQTRQLNDRGEPTGDVFVETTGVGKEIRDHFSKRRQSVEAYMREHNVEAQHAALATRKTKDEPTFSELTEIWSRTIDGLRRDNPELLPSTTELKQLPDRVEPMTDQQIIAALEEKQAVWNRHDLLRHLAQERPGTRINELVQEVDAFTKRNGIERVKPEQIHADDRGLTLAKRHTEDRFASTSMLEVEQKMLTEARSRRDDTQHALAPEQVAAAVERYEKQRGFQLSQEQRAGVDHLAGKGGVGILAGRAGTGKTSTIGAVVDAYKEAGYQVLGVATAWQAARKLEAESGIESKSIRAFSSAIDKGTLQLKPRSLVIVDEAGMVGTRALEHVQSAVDKAGGKLLLLGDHHQLQAVEAGGPLRLLSKTVGAAQLTEIRRQEWQPGLETARSFYDAPDRLRSRGENRELGAAILDKLKRSATIVPAESTKQAREDLVTDWLASPTPAAEKLILAGTRRDCDALNRSVRDGLRKAGKLGAKDHEIATDAGTLGVAAGDRVRFGKRDKDVGVVNGSVAVIERVYRGKDGQVTVQGRVESDIKSEHGRALTWAADRKLSIEHAYAITVHKSQGEGRGEVYQLAHKGMTDRHLQLVAFTRAKRSFKLYGSDQDLDPRLLPERIGTDRFKDNASEHRRSQAPARASQPRRSQAPSKAPSAPFKPVGVYSLVDRARAALTSVRDNLDRVRVRLGLTPASREPSRGSWVQR